MSASVSLLWFLNRLGPASRQAKGEGKVAVLSVWARDVLGGPPFWFMKFALSTVAV